MKRNYIVCILFALLGCLNMQAYDFEVGGIYYNITGTDSVSVAFGANRYEGSITIPATVQYESEVYNVVAIDSAAFYYCTGMTSIALPESVTKIGMSAFRNCSGLTSLTIPAGVTSIAYSAFFGCSGLTTINLPAGVTTVEPYTFFGCKRLTSINLGGISKIGGSAFAGCVALSNVVLPETLTVIESHTFEGCSGLKSINIPAGVKNIGDYAFRNCGLTSIAFPEGVAQIGRYTFEGCTGLTSLYFPSSIKSISFSSFVGCTNLGSITVADGNTVYDSRNNCNAVVETYIVDAKTEKKAYRLILGCKSSIIPEGVDEIASYAFMNCTGLANLIIPESVSSIGVSSFQGSDLTSVVIPEGVATIDSDCFADCKSLTSVTLPKTVKNIYDGAFKNCTALETFYCNVEADNSKVNISVAADAFDSTPIEQVTLYVPENSVEKYGEVAPWNQFAAIMVIGENLVSPQKDSETAIESLKGAGKVQQVYGLGGQQSSKLQRGINVVRMSDGTTRKVLVK